MRGEIRAGDLPDTAHREMNLMHDAPLGIEPELVDMPVAMRGRRRFYLDAIDDPRLAPVLDDI